MHMCMCDRMYVHVCCSYVCLPATSVSSHWRPSRLWCQTHQHLLYKHDCGMLRCGTKMVTTCYRSMDGPRQHDGSGHRVMSYRAWHVASYHGGIRELMSCHVMPRQVMSWTCSCSMFSTYQQSWSANMSIRSDPILTRDTKSTSSNKRTSWTRITFTPDFVRFGVTGWSDDMRALLTRRALDLAACCTDAGVQVSFNGEEMWHAWVCAMCVERQHACCVGLCDVSDVLNVIRCAATLDVVACMLTCYTRCVVCFTSRVASIMLHVACCMLHVACRISHLPQTRSSPSHPSPTISLCFLHPHMANSCINASMHIGRYTWAQS